MLRPTGHLGDNPRRLEGLIQSINCLRDPLFTLDPTFLEKPCNTTVLFWIEESKGKILKLPFQLPKPQAVGQRRQHLQRILGKTRLGITLGCRVITQGLKTRRQAQQHHPDIGRHRQQHPAQRFELRGGGDRVGRNR